MLELKTNHSENPFPSVGPAGFVWDHINWSCAYDSFFTIMYYISTTNPHKWNRQLMGLISNATLLVNSFQKIYNNTYTGEQARDSV